MNDALRDVLVTGYEHLIERLQLPDPDDQHVLAAAIQAEADFIVTHNLRDFPAETLKVWGVTAQTSDTFLTNLLQEHPNAIGHIALVIARARSATTARDVLAGLAAEAPTAAALAMEGLQERA